MFQNKIDSLSFEQIRDNYTEYLCAQNLSPLTVQTSRTDAFYLLRHDDTIDFWQMLCSDDFETQALLHLQSILSKRSKGNVSTNVNGYMYHLRRLRQFLYADTVGATTQKAEVEKMSKNRVPIRVRLNIPTPTDAEVRNYQAAWDTLDDYREQEQALNRLFFELAPKNTDITDVLLKAVALNHFYSTNIYSIYPVAAHIQTLQIDERLQSGDESLVSDIMSVAINGKQKQFYSFASKYCSHHNPMAYPIYDSYVDVVLRYFRDVDRFCGFQTCELKNYSRFKEILGAFQCFYGLEQFSLKEIDKYLWQFGKKHFPKQYKQTTPHKSPSPEPHL